MIKTPIAIAAGRGGAFIAQPALGQFGLEPDLKICIKRFDIVSTRTASSRREGKKQDQIWRTSNGRTTAMVNN